MELLVGCVAGFCIGGATVWRSSAVMSLCGLPGILAGGLPGVFAGAATGTRVRAAGLRTAITARVVVLGTILAGQG